MRSTRLAALVAATALSCLPGCGSSDRAVTGSGSFPVTVKASNGTVAIPDRPKRIVSISATATEDLFAVGAGRQVVAVDDYSTYPNQAPRTKLSGYSPNAEAIAGYRPDLVVTADDTNHVVAALAKLRIPVLVDPPARDLDAAYGQLEQLGTATGHAEEARAVVARMRSRIAAITRSLPKGRRALSVYHELDGNYYSATSATFIGSVYRLAGLRNVADKAMKAAPYPKLSAEYVVSANPDLIVLADTVCCGQSMETIRKRPGFGGVAAVRHGAVLAVPDDLPSHWGPRIVDFLALVVREVRGLEAGA
jgi:iron complex transport system substrate-binding protein